jgi:uncharacterized phage-like protein YoqJ
MKLMVSGHRIEKLLNYDIEWIKDSIDTVVQNLMLDGVSYGMSGMASGVDLWFCAACVKNKLPYSACIPFDEQAEYMDESWAALRQQYIQMAVNVMQVKNSRMTEDCQWAVVVWDGNKGGTHNCFQQLLEYNKNIVWIIPNRKKIVTL